MHRGISHAWIEHIIELWISYDDHTIQVDKSYISTNLIKQHMDKSYISTRHVLRNNDQQAITNHIRSRLYRCLQDDRTKKRTTTEEEAER